MTPDEQGILDKAKENLEAAQLLLDQGFIGIAASRTYYAMFYLAEALLLRKGLHFPVTPRLLQLLEKNMPKQEKLIPNTTST